MISKQFFSLWGISLRFKNPLGFHVNRFPGDTRTFLSLLNVPSSIQFLQFAAGFLCIFTRKSLCSFFCSRHLIITHFSLGSSPKCRAEASPKSPLANAKSSGLPERLTIPQRHLLDPAFIGWATIVQLCICNPFFPLDSSVLGLQLQDTFFIQDGQTWHLSD